MYAYTLNMREKYSRMYIHANKVANHFLKILIYHTTVY